MRDRRDYGVKTRGGIGNYCRGDVEKAIGREYLVREHGDLVIPDHPLLAPTQAFIMGRTWKGFPTSVAYFRMSANIPIKEMAVKLKIGEEAYEKWEKGEINRTDKRLREVANILGVHWIRLLRDPRKAIDDNAE